MDKLLAGSVVWRIVTAIASFLCRLGSGCALFAALGRWWRDSRVCAFFCRLLGPEPLPTAECGFTAVLDRRNVRLAQKHNLRTAWPHSVPGRLYGAVIRCGSQSRLVGWLFRGGMTSFLLFILGIYVLVDYGLRDLFAIPLVSSVWDEAFLIFTLLWIVWQKMDRVSPLWARTNPLDFSVMTFVVVGFVLMNVVAPYYSIQISGYRATVQHLLWFFLATRLIRNRRDVLQLYVVLVASATLIALHGIYQYIVGVPMPAQWVAAAETAVRTRVFSIFGSPNIMGCYMVMFVPMAVALAYYTEKTELKALGWFCAIVMCVACLFTMSRGAWAAMAVTILLFILLVDRRLFWLIAAAGVMLVFVPFVRTRIGFLFTDDFVAANSSGGRGERWVVAMTLLHSVNPWLGYGLGMFGGAVAMQNQVMDWIPYFYVDNYYMKILTEMGYIGFAAFVIMLLCWLYTGARSLYRTKTKTMACSAYPLIAGIFSGLMGVFVHCYSENIFEEPYMMVYFWTMTAMMVWLGFLERKGRRPIGNR